MRLCTLAEARGLCERHHGYASAGGSATYAFGIYENERIVAAYLWQPPPPGAARAVCPEAPAGVLALSRMVAVPRDERALRHVSKPLRKQMRAVIDRGRWPVLLTYSDEGQGHTGHVYRCSGWLPTTKARHPTFADPAGARVSRYSNGKSSTVGLTRCGMTTLQRWEHWICSRGEAAVWMEMHGWRRVPVPGKVWRSGNQAFTYERTG